jgi:hypothetical protein
LRAFLNPKFTTIEEGVAEIVAKRRVEAARFNCYTEPVLP